ncbi:unnamed protein product [Boreogadus saida]
MMSPEVDPLSPPFALRGSTAVGIGVAAPPARRWHGLMRRLSPTEPTSVGSVGLRRQPSSGPEAVVRCVEQQTGAEPEDL